MGKVVAEGFCGSVKTREIGLELRRVVVLPITALVGDDEVGHGVVSDAAKQIDERDVSRHAGVVGLDRHDANRLAARRNQVAQRVQLSLGIEQERHDLQFARRLKDDARQPRVGIVDGDGVPASACGVRGPFLQRVLSRVSLTA